MVVVPFFPDRRYYPNLLDLFAEFYEFSKSNFDYFLLIAPNNVSIGVEKVLLRRGKVLK